MQQMVWDEELAKAAQMFAEECVFQRQNQADRIGEQYREDTKVNFVGQILAGRKTSLAMLDVVRVVYSLAGARGSEFNQIVFPLSGRIGCGFNFCRHVQKSEEYRTDSTIIICNYAPGSTGEVKAVSQEGEGCSSCLFEQKCFQEYLCSATGEEATVKEDDNTDPPSSVPCELGACGVSVRDYHELFHRWKVCVHICLYVLMFDVGCMYLCLMLAVCTYV
jgi:hypothetical protein